MKQWIKNALSTVVTCLLLWLCISRLGYIVRPTYTDAAYSQIETFHQLPENSVEVLIYGSSHAYKGIDPLVMYDEYGIGAYNYGWNWQRCNTINLFLKDSLEKQTPKIVLIEGYTIDEVMQDTDINAEIFYSRYLHNESAKAHYIRQCFGTNPEGYLSFYMPLSAFHDNWNTLTDKSFKPMEVGTRHRRTMGYSASDEVKKIKIPDYRSFEQKELPPEAVSEISDMIATCRSKGIEVIFYTVPWKGEYHFSGAMKKIAEENGCVYLDLFELAGEAGLDGNTDFRNTGHLNDSGSAKVADFLGKYIAANYDVTDMRTVSGNLWETAKRRK